MKNNVRPRSSFDYHGPILETLICTKATLLSRIFPQAFQETIEHREKGGHAGCHTPHHHHTTRFNG